MGMVWEAYHKGVPLLGVPGITLDTSWMGFGINFYISGDSGVATSQDASDH